MYDIQKLKMEICEEHKVVFPNATKPTQALKYLEEMIEFSEADNNVDKLKELCDIFNCGSGMARFDLKYSDFICSKAVAVMTIYFKADTDEEYDRRIYGMIKENWDEKKKRKLEEIEPGVYHHIKENK